MIKIKKEIIEKLIEHAEKEKPLEACGYLCGKDGIGDTIFELTNIDASPEHFSFDPKDQFRVIKESRNLGIKPLAVYHSHPATPGRPSAEDIKLAYDPEISYIIVSLAEEKPIINSFRIKNGIAEKEEVEVIK